MAKSESKYLNLPDRTLALILKHNEVNLSLGMTEEELDFVRNLLRTRLGIGSSSLGDSYYSAGEGRIGPKRFLRKGP